jgi:GT2 family glycosyltransferase
MESFKTTNYKLSYIVITNGAKADITHVCLKSILHILREEDELIVVGDVDKFKSVSDKIKFIEAKETAHLGNICGLRNKGVAASTGDIIINADSDIFFFSNFTTKLINYLDNNKDIHVFNTKMYLPDGGRWWDRAVYRGNGNTFLVDYDYNLEDLFFTGSFIIRRRNLAKSVPYSENPLFLYNSSHPINSNDPYLKSLDAYEDVDYTKTLKQLGYPITIDLDNTIIHYDANYLSVVRDDGSRCIVKRADFQQDHKIEQNRNMCKLFHSELLKFLK